MRTCTTWKRPTMWNRVPAVRCLVVASVVLSPWTAPHACVAGASTGGPRPWSPTTPVITALDTVWIGHVIAITGLPGTPGGYGPYHVGRGLALPGVDPDGIWTFDHNQAGLDSLQGWWPITRAYTATAGL